MPDEDTKAALLRASKPPSKEFFAALITANHILHYHRVLGSEGHVSVRNPQDHATFFMSKPLASALVSSRADIVEYRIADADPVKDATDGVTSGCSERFIHSEIYKKYGQVMSIVHSHSDTVIPFSIGSVPLRPVSQAASTIGARVPCFDATLHLKSSDSKSLLVTSQHMGQALAAGFSPSNVFAKTTTFFKNLVTSTEPDPAPYPSCSTVLMRGHGFTCAGRDLRDAVCRAVSTCSNARAQTAALMIQGTFNVGLIGERFGASQKDSGPAKQEYIQYLSDEECKGSWASNSETAERAWALWSVEVANSNTYKNQIV